MSNYLDVLTDQKERKQFIDILTQVQPQMDSLINELNVGHQTHYNTQNIIDKINSNMLHFRYVNQDYPNWPDSAAGKAHRSWEIFEPDTLFVKPVNDKFLDNLELSDNSIRTLIHELWHHSGPSKGWGSKKKGLEDYLYENMGIMHTTDKNQHKGSQHHYNEAEDFMIDLLQKKGLWDSLQGLLPNQQQNISVRGY